jgi:hypothetical protein
MALIQGTTAVSLIVGSAGPNTYSRNRGGNYLKPRKTVTNPRSTYQQNVRGMLGSLSAAWRSLDDATRNAWNAITSEFPYTDKIGNVKYYSGFNLFCKFNQNLLLIGSSINNTPYHPTDNGTITEFYVISLLRGNITLHATCTGGYSNSTILFYASNGQSAGVGVISPSTYKYYDNEDTTPPIEPNNYTQYSARGLNYTTGQKVFFKCKLVNTTNGQESAEAICNAISS